LENNFNREFDQEGISEELLVEIRHFESFFGRLGFKRIDGAIYGLLVLSTNPLSSQQIQSSLSLSQGAVSSSLKTLSLYGAIETLDSKDTRCHLHQASPDALNIVASVFRKREQESVASFKRVLQRVLANTPDDQQHSIRRERLVSIITTCMMAEAVMNFVMQLGINGMNRYYKKVAEALPETLTALSSGIKLKDSIAGQVKSRLWEGLERLAQGVEQ
jgi:DNA-binding transcriptional regulator GbsR (MarR family)